MIRPDYLRVLGSALETLGEWVGKDPRLFRGKGFSLYIIFLLRFFMINRVKEVREFFNVSQLSLALMVGVSRETINRLENGTHKPSLKLAHDIASVFGCSIEYLFCLR